MHFFVFSPLLRARDVFLFNLPTDFSVPITFIATNTPQSFPLEVLFASKYSSYFSFQLNTRHYGRTFKPSSSSLLLLQEDIGVSPCQKCVFLLFSLPSTDLLVLTLFIPQKYPTSMTSSKKKYHTPQQTSKSLERHTTATG
jgi:hypothetical protein